MSLPTHLVSSNPKKLAEYANYGLKLKLMTGDDLPEVCGTPDEIALYKAVSAGEGAVIEDTILVINGRPEIDIKWTLDILRQKIAKAEWVVTLAHHAGNEVRLYRGVVAGDIRPGPVPPEGFFGFDPWFVPTGQDLTVHDMTKMGRKGEFSPRRLAAELLSSGQPSRVVLINEIPPWKGEWQSGTSLKKQTKTPA